MGPIAKCLIKHSASFRRFVFKLNRAAFPKKIPKNALPEKCKARSGAAVGSATPVKAVPAKASSAKKPLSADVEFTYPEETYYTGTMVNYLSSETLSYEMREIELKRIFFKKCGYYLDLDNPRTFNQKLQWLKRRYFIPEQARCVDKAEFKAYVEEQLGEPLAVPMYGVWDKENEVDFDSLPDRFVLKSTLQSDSRHIILVKDKSTLNLDEVKTIMALWTSPRNALSSSFCCAYYGLKPRILAEEYIEGLANESVIDYKFMCFNGKAEMLFVVCGRKKEMSVDFFDLDWNHLPFTRKYPNADYEVKKPRNFDKMVEVANKLAKPFPFVRVDFYESADGSNFYVGELTFYPGGGYEPFQPIEWDYKLGDMIDLPEQNLFL